MDEEKMKEFNQVFGNIDVPKQADAPDVTPYHAVGNLNTALNNPNMNAGSAMGSNIATTGQIDNTMSVNNLLQAQPDALEPKTPEVVQTTEVKQEPKPVETFDPSTLDVTEKTYEHEPLRDMEVNKTTTFISNQNIPKKRKSLKFKLSKDAQVIILMLLIIFIFVMILPVISDFMSGLRGYN